MKNREQDTSNEKERWVAAKQRVRNAYARTNTELIFVWRDIISDINTTQKSNVEILELLADYAEQCADNLMPDNSKVDVDMWLDDRLLENTFQLWRKFDKDRAAIESQCCYCGNKNATINSWKTSTSVAIEEDIPLVIYVCSTNDECANKAREDGYAVEIQGYKPRT